MRVIITRTPEEFGKEAFGVVASVLDSNPAAVLGLATGSTPLPLYREMIAERAATGRSYKSVTTFNLDEYVGLGADDEQSYVSFMRDNLFYGLDIPPENVNIPNGLAPAADAECKRYSALLSKRQIDLQVLGIGANGHIAFNEPFTGFDSTTHVAALTEKTIADNARFFADQTKVPRFAITMGISEIVRAKKILLLAAGAGKAAAVRAMLEGEVTTACPASALRAHPDVVCVLDEGAASEITLD